jgi:hypothetical protein
MPVSAGSGKASSSTTGGAPNITANLFYVKDNLIIYIRKI